MVEHQDTVLMQPEGPMIVEAQVTEEGSPGSELSKSVTFRLEPPRADGSLRMHNLHHSMPPGMMFADLKDESDVENDLGDDGGEGGANAFQDREKWICRSSGRPDHIHSVIARTRASIRYIQDQQGDKFSSVASTKSEEDEKKEDKKNEDEGVELRFVSQTDTSIDMAEMFDEKSRKDLEKESEYIHRVLTTYRKVQRAAPRRGHQIEVRMKDFNFYVPTKERKESFVANVWNQSVLYAVLEFFRRVDRVLKYKRKKRHRHSGSTHHSPDSIRGLDDSERGQRRLFPKEYRKVLHDISLCLRPGKMYLVLGSPGSGKTSFLKAIAGLLPHTNDSGAFILKPGLCRTCLLRVEVKLDVCLEATQDQQEHRNKWIGLLAKVQKQ